MSKSKNLFENRLKYHVNPRFLTKQNKAVKARVNAKVTVDENSGIDSGFP